jgi:hypothetical protein
MASTGITLILEKWSSGSDVEVEGMKRQTHHGDLLIPLFPHGRKAD